MLKSGSHLPKRNIFCSICLMKALKNYEKFFICDLKSSFRSQDI